MLCSLLHRIEEKVENSSRILRILALFGLRVIWFFVQDEAEGAPEAEGEGEVEGHGEVEVESDVELHDVEPDPGESEGEREQSSQEIDIGDQREESEVKDSDSDEKEEYGQRVVTSRRREVIESGSERSEENHYPDNEDEEVDQARSPR